jgi:hypothetical protein
MLRKIRLPSRAMAVALIALFVALGGTAGAATYAIVPLAKRALSADNAKKLQGKTAAQLVEQAAETPGPASSAADLVSTKTGQATIAPQNATDQTVSCDPGQKAIAGGYTTPQTVAALDTRPTSDQSGWSIFLLNLENSQTANVTLYAVCVA